MFDADLHQHSLASDGLLAPAELMELDHAQGLKIVSLTDHDTLAGQEEAKRAAVHLDLQYIYGVELSCRLPANAPDPKCVTPGRQKVHILGYWPEMPVGQITKVLEQQIIMRHRRAREIGRRLKAINRPIDIEALLAQHRGGHIGRPHFAMAMVEAGYVTSQQEAFDRYLHDGGPAYVPYSDPLSAAEAIALITSSHGMAVMAHPGEYGLGAIDPYLPQLIAAGLGGIECSHPRNAGETDHYYRTICEKEGLMVTGGSDFHGPVKKGVPLPGRCGCFASDIAPILRLLGNNG